MASGAFSLRTAGLIATGAVAVHELRYLLGGAEVDPAAGHAYLPVVGLLSALLLGLACAQLVAVVERARRTGGDEGRPSDRVGFLATWALATLALVLIFVAQELLEGLLAEGRVADPGAAYAGGGWTAVPAAATVGALLALALVGARRVVAAAAQGARRAPSARRRRPRRRALARGHRLAGPPLACHLAGRAPPFLTS